MVEHYPPAIRRPCHVPGAPAAPHPVTASGHARRPDGQVEHLVLAHLRAHPGLDFSPYELAKALRLSHGTVRRHLLRLAAAGLVRQTSLTPARFQIST
jgi:DNA-binding transcriptional ArsR family regulator